MKHTINTLALLLVISTYANLLAADRIIGGVEVPPDYFKEVVRISGPKGHCTGTLVGPRAVLTAAHCGESKAQVNVHINGKQVTGVLHRPKNYMQDDLDVALVVLDTETTIQPASVSADFNVGDSIFILGYGCTLPSGEGATDFKLRLGETKVESLSNSDLVLRREDGAALCFGDSGGPAFIRTENGYELVGIGNKGNIKDTSWATIVTHKNTLDFLDSVMSEFGVSICGINKACQETTEKLEFHQSLYEYTVSPGSAFTLWPRQLLKCNNFKDITWQLSDGPSWFSTSKPDQLSAKIPGGVTGVFAWTLLAQTKTGSAETKIVLHVAPKPVQPLACELSATPNFIELGKSLTLSLNIFGIAKTVVISGASEKPISHHPAPKLDFVITPTSAGVYGITATVTNDERTATCTTRYAVK